MVFKYDDITHIRTHLVVPSTVARKLFRMLDIRQAGNWSIGDLLSYIRGKGLVTTHETKNS